MESPKGNVRLGKQRKHDKTERIGKHRSKSASMYLQILGVPEPTDMTTATAYLSSSGGEAGGGEAGGGEAGGGRVGGGRAGGRRGDGWGNFHQVEQ